MLPRFPNLVGFEDLDALLAEHAHVHLLDLLAPDAPTLRVLDGVWVPGNGLSWKPVDAAFLRAWHGPSTAAPAVTALCAALEHDRLAVRRVVLYQLVRDLQRHRGRAVVTARAAHLRIHPDEIPYIAAAAVASAPGADREAAESLASVWQAGSLARARELAERLTEQRVDHVLDRVCRDIERAGRVRDRLTNIATRAEAAGDTDSAITVWTRLWKRWADGPAYDGLTRHAPPGPAVRARFGGDRVTLDWQHVEAGGHIDYAVARLADDHPPGQEAAAEPLGTVSVPRFEDTTPPPGRRIRYLVAARRDEVAGAWATTATVSTAPELPDLYLEPIRGGIGGRWAEPPAGAEIRVTRRADHPPTSPGDGTDVPVRADKRGFADTGLPEDSAWHYLAVAAYRCPDGTFAYSTGRSANTVVRAWPDPVELLDAHADEAGTVRVTWTEPARGHVHARWYDDGAAPEPGRPLPSGTVGDPVEPPHDFGLHPHGIRTLGFATRRGPLTVAGPGLRVEVAEPVEQLRAEHVAEVVRVLWTWPATTQRVEIDWHGHTQDGLPITGRRVVARAEYRVRGVDLPIAAASTCRITVRPIVTSDADVLVRPARAVPLGARRTVRYRIRKPNLFARDRRATVVITIDGRPEGPVGLTLLARPGREMPLTVEQGRVLLRLPDACPDPDRPLDIRVDLRDLPRPSHLRAFLDGPNAASCRLEHPSTETLLVT
ncbi:hypothetical protein [Streptomyces sp. SID3343]|uniref:hypothetical protein n=1 Tax=Streptomyces sp. SID3343 TaxID=2690260 RepID=UPI00136E6A73|nr:hypothetical protein [Streptomyces sp. SID3343]MYW05332.1 hypothetical protein [Streptomyces sp. SID3343]